MTGRKNTPLIVLAAAAVTSIALVVGITLAGGAPDNATGPVAAPTTLALPAAAPQLPPPMSRPAPDIAPTGSVASSPPAEPSRLVITSGEPLPVPTVDLSPAGPQLYPEDPDPTLAEQVAAAYVRASQLHADHQVGQAMATAPWSTQQLTDDMLKQTAVQAATRAQEVVIHQVSVLPRPPSTDSNTGLLVDFTIRIDSGGHSTEVALQHALWLQLQSDGSWKVDRILPIAN